MVAPHVGAWIETCVAISALAVIIVAPHVGAWIETPNAKTIISVTVVAPHVGAWIETVPGCCFVRGCSSRLT